MAAEIGLKAVMDMAGFTAGIHKFNQLVGGATSATVHGAQAMTHALATVGKAAAGIAVGGIAALTTTIIAGTKAATNWAEKIDSVGDVLGTTAEESSALAVAAQHIGGNVEQLSSQMAILTRGLFDAKGQIGPTGLIMQKLGIAFKDANGKILPSSQIIQSVADKIGNMPDGLEKTQLMMDLFGKSGKDMSDMLNALANGGMQKFDEQAKSMGLSMSEEAAAGAIGFGRSINDLKMMLQGFLVSVGTEFMPIMGGITEVLGDVLPIAINFLRGLFEKLSPPIKFVTGVFSELLWQLSHGVDPIGAISEALMRFFGMEVGLKFFEIATAVKEFVTNVISLVKEGKWDELGKTIADGVKAVWTFLTEWFQSVDWEALGNKIITGIENAIKVGWPILKAQFEGIWNFLVAWFNSVDWPRLGNIIITGIKTFIETAWPIVKNAFIIVKDAVVAWFKSVDWPELGRIIFITVKTWITTSAWPWLKNAFVDVKDAIIAWFKSVDWGEVGRILLDAVKKVIETAWDLSQGIGKAFVDLAKKIIDWGIHYDWGALGASILNAIINAIKSGAGAIWDAIVAALSGGTTGGETGGGKTHTPSGPRGGDQFSGLRLPTVQQLMSTLSGLKDYGGMTSFASAIMGRFNSRVIAPLESESEKWADQQKKATEALEDETLSNGERLFWNFRLQEANKEQEAITKKLNEEKERELKLQQQLDDLSFLQAQMDFISFLEENELDMVDILGGLQLGLDLDIGSFMDAMTNAIQALVNNMALGLPSGAGSAEGPEGGLGGGLLASGGRGGGGMQVYNNQNVTVNMNVALNNGMDTEQFKVMVRDVVMGDLR